MPLLELPTGQVNVAMNLTGEEPTAP